MCFITHRKYFWSFFICWSSLIGKSKGLNRPVKLFVLLIYPATQCSWFDQILLKWADLAALACWLSQKDKGFGHFCLVPYFGIWKKAKLPKNEKNLLQVVSELIKLSMKKISIRAPCFYQSNPYKLTLLCKLPEHLLHIFWFHN